MTTQAQSPSQAPAATLLYAKEWSNLDPNPITSRFVQSLISLLEDPQKEVCEKASNNNEKTHTDEANENDAISELLLCFPSTSKRIEFGTAGLRGRMHPGPVHMNDLVVIQTAQGLARYVLRQHEHNAGKNQTLRAVVGYDHRYSPEFNLSSKKFAIYTKLVFESAGISCILLDGYIATPILAYAVTRCKAAVGVMVTASHNPKMDNGYKVYWGDGCQINQPRDREISKVILEDMNFIPWKDYGQIVQDLEARTNTAEGADATTGECFGLSDQKETKEIQNAYFHSFSNLVTGVREACENASSISSSSSTPQVRIAYTAMHGVGHPFALLSFQSFNLPPFYSVPLQCQPDFNFPTVAFPNPEEKGALDKAMEFSEREGCDVVLANDPDADRLGVAEFNRGSGEGEGSGKWTVFTGDEIGAILGHFLWETVGKTSNRPVAMVNSTVSSKLLSTIGRVEGFHVEESLTGFKWIGSTALSLQKKGYNVLFGYEEAIGFSCGGIIPDKDGLSAMGVMGVLVHDLYSKNEFLGSYLQGIRDKYGEFVSNNGYFRCNKEEYKPVFDKILAEMRNDGKYFSRVGNYDVKSVRDLGLPGFDSSTEDKKPVLPTSSSSPMITFRFANGCVAQFRASGTEPKFKYYIELKGKPKESREQVHHRLHEMSSIVLEELLHPKLNGLILPSHL